MKIWSLYHNVYYNRLEFSDFEDYEKIIKLFEFPRSLTNEWSNVEMTLIDRGKPSDILGEVGGMLIVSKKAKELFAQVTQLNVEFLPFDLQGNYYLMNILTVLDCINAEQSKEERILERLVDYEQLALYEDVVKGHDVFKIKFHEGEKVLKWIYISDKLKELITENLEGYDLIEIWDSQFSWQEKIEKYDLIGKEIDDGLTNKFDFNSAIKYIKKNKGKMAYSGHWSLKVDNDDEILLGSLQLDGTYTWTNPIYYPPIILTLTWGNMDKKITFFDKLKGAVSFK